MENTVDLEKVFGHLFEEETENVVIETKKKVPSCSCHHSEPLSKILLKLWIVENTDILNAKELVFVCIGTDRSTGDSLGPLVGHKLKDYVIDNTYVYGTLKDPVHAQNLAEYRETITNKHPDAFIIAIDACLGRQESVGKLHVSTEPLSPGAAMDKKLGKIGDIGVTGIVNTSGAFEFMVLQNTRLFTTMSLADTIVDNMLSLINEYGLHQNNRAVAIGEN